jgi:hypothetical protein
MILVPEGDELVRSIRAFICAGTLSVGMSLWTTDEQHSAINGKLL